MYSYNAVQCVETKLVPRYYYQYHEERLSACTLTIHGLLHLADGIQECGPVWTMWTFYMERFCGMLQRSLLSHVQPWSNLNKSLLHAIYLEQLGVHYNLQDELQHVSNRIDDGVENYSVVTVLVD